LGKKPVEKLRGTRLSLDRGKGVAESGRSASQFKKRVGEKGKKGFNAGKMTSANKKREKVKKKWNTKIVSKSLYILLT